LSDSVGVGGVVAVGKSVNAHAYVFAHAQAHDAAYVGIWYTR
jgi:hypothetical protein